LKNKINKPVIQVRNLEKHFTVDETGRGLWGSVKALFHRRHRTIMAVDKINFHVNQGEFVGYVGENGAGKSTTIKMLTGILVPTGGEVEVNGIFPYKDRQRNASNIGVVFGQRTQLWWDLPVRESFEMLKVIFRVSDGDFKESFKKLSKTLDLEPLLGMPVRKLSLGQRMRCDIAASLIHRPSVLFLDEPTIGLDVLAKESIRKFLAEINKKEGTTIILTTHDMNDIEELCKRLIILDKGKIIYDGDTNALKKKFVHEKIIEVEFHDSADGFDSIPGIEITKDEGCKKTLKYENNSIGIGELIGLIADNYKLKDISIREPSVENIIRNIYDNRLTLPESFNAGKPEASQKQ